MTFIPPFPDAELDWHALQRDECFVRPAELLELVGNSLHTKTLLAWERVTFFGMLLREMVRAEFEELRP